MFQSYKPVLLRARFPRVHSNIASALASLSAIRQFQHHRRLYHKYALNDQIYIHEGGNKGVYTFNLSENPQALPIGYCDNIKNINPNNFYVNEKFVEVLHDTISNQIQDDFTFIMEAGANANLYMPIYDFREVPRYGRIPEVDNIYGYVMVTEQGKIVPGSYQSNNLYRICNGAGLIKLSDYLLEQLQSITSKA